MKASGRATRSKRGASRPSRRSAVSNRIRSVTPWRAALRRAIERAAGEMSVAVIGYITAETKTALPPERTQGLRFGEGELTIHDVDLNPRRTGLLDVLDRMGARITVFHRRRSGGWRCRHGALQPQRPLRGVFPPTSASYFAMIP